MRHFFIYLLFIVTLFSCANTPGYQTKTASKKTINTEAGIAKFDTTITGFKLAAIMNTKLVFTAHGKEDAENTEPTTGFFIQGFSGMDYDAAKKKLQEYAYGRKNNENVVSAEDETIKIYNTAYGKAIFTTVILKYKNNKTAVATIATVSNGKNAILFVGEDYNKGDYTDEFKNTFNSIEFSVPGSAD